MTNKQVNILQLNKLRKDAKEKIYNKLINGEYTATIDIITHGRVYKDCDVLFTGDNHHESDLCISHFGYNFYVRANRAINGKRYKTFGACIGALKKLIKSKFDVPTCSSNLRIYNSNPSWYGENIFNIEV